MKYQNLHSHTTTSDGLLSYREVLEVCEKNNLGVLAFTDHDAVMSEKTINELKSGIYSTKWISGIEISSGLPQELGGGPSSGLHIIGLFVDPFNKELLEHCAKAQEARIKRMQHTVKNLKNLGFDITEEDCLKASGGESIGRPHIVAAIRSKDSNLKVIEEIRLKMKKDAENDIKIKKKYDEMISFGEGQYPYMLFLEKDAYIKGVYIGYTYYVNMDKSVSLIRNAGGLAFLAHWFTIKKQITEEILDKLLSENKLDGVETICGLWTSKAQPREEIEKDELILTKLIEKNNKLKSGGVDAHKREDFELFEKEKWYSEKTVGMVEKIIDKSKVDTKWSSLEK